MSKQWFVGHNILLRHLYLTSHFSKSFKALSFSAKKLFVSFRSTRVIFTTWCYFVYNKSNETFELSDFRISRNVSTKVGDNERKSSKGPKILFDLPRYSRYRGLDYREFFLPNIVRNDQWTKEFVRAIQKFGKLSIRVFESLLKLFASY